MKRNLTSDKIKTVKELKQYLSSMKDDTRLSDIRIKMIKPCKFSATINLNGLIVDAEEESDARKIIISILKESRFFQMLSDKKDGWDVYDVELNEDEDEDE